MAKRRFLQTFGNQNPPPGKKGGKGSAKEQKAGRKTRRTYKRVQHKGGG